MANTSQPQSAQLEAPPMVPIGRYDDNVFINCPFDDLYSPLFRAIVFAIHDAGFVARCALEVSDSSQTRLDKILEIIRDCKYGIHDISRTEPGTTGLPRFNMPFECGLFWGCQAFGDERDRAKRILVLDRAPFRYHEFFSDIAGQDIQAHNDDPKTAIDKIRVWLRSTSGRSTIPGGEMIWSRYQVFQQELPDILAQSPAHITINELNKREYFPDYVRIITAWITRREAIATSNKTPAESPPPSS